MYEVVGLERVDYENKSGRRVTGWRVHYVFDLPERGNPNEGGRGCDTCYCSDLVFADAGITVGSPAMPVYDKRGRVVGFMASPT